MIMHQLYMSFIYKQLIDHTVLFQTIKFNISHLLVLSLNVKQFFPPIDRTLSGANTPGESGSGSDGDEGVIFIW